MKIKTLTAVQKIEIINFYLAPHTLNETAAQFNINKYSIKKILVENNIKLHSREVRSARIKQAFTEQYGVDNPSKNKSIQEKIKKTSLAKYGTDRPQKAEAVKEKAKNTCLDKYGAISSAQNKDIQNKIKRTNLERYGYACSLQNEDIQAKSKQTVLEKYNVDNVMQNDGIKEKVKRTMLQRYGVEYAPQNEEIKEKSKATCQQKYGVDYPGMSPSAISKGQHTMQTRYGVTHPSQSKEILTRSFETKRKRNTFNSSAPEEKYYIYLCKKYSVEDIFRQYSDKRYPFNCDFYIKSLDLFIELNLSWTHGNKPFENTAEDLCKLAIWREKAKTSVYYQNAIDVWTRRDIKKQQIAKENNLNYKVYYSEAELEAELQEIN